MNFTNHPFLEAPTAKDIVWLYNNDLSLLKELHTAHESRIKASEDDPVRHGFDLPGWGRIEEALQQHNECLALGGNRSGKTLSLIHI